jgi:aromatic ring hydroxylase
MPSNHEVEQPHTNSRPAAGVRAGAEYLAGLRDGRRVYHAGKKIEDVTTHPGIAGAARTVAKIYDLQHDPDYGPRMTTTWNGKRISLSYLPPRTMDELLAKRENTTIQARATLGLMGRLPDFCSNLTVGLLNIVDILAEASPRFAENAVNYHRYCAYNDVALTHALNDQFYDRSKPASTQPNPDQILRVVRETEGGPIVRGLRNLVTLAPLSDEVIVYPNRPRRPDEEDFSLAFAIPMSSPGLYMICRDLYAQQSTADRLPLSSRLDEIDTTLIFDDVHVPWERIFVYRNPALANRILDLINPPWSGYVTMTRLAVKLETFAAVAEIMSRWNGRNTDPDTQRRIGTLLTDLEVHRACLNAMETAARRTPAGYLMPNSNDAYRLHGVAASDRAEMLFRDILTSSLVLTGSESDMSEPDIGAFVAKYFKGTAPDTRSNLRLMAVAADLMQSAFGVRSQLYERFHAGPPDMIVQRLYRKYDLDSLVEPLLRYMSELG